VCQGRFSFRIEYILEFLFRIVPKVLIAAEFLLNDFLLEYLRATIEHINTIHI